MRPYAWDTALGMSGGFRSPFGQGTPPLFEDRVSIRRLLGFLTLRWHGRQHSASLVFGESQHEPSKLPFLDPSAPDLPCVAHRVCELEFRPWANCH